MSNDQASGSIVHVELRSTNPGKTKAFFRSVFGWKFRRLPEMGHSMIEAPSSPRRDLGKADVGEDPGILNFIRVSSVATTSRKIGEAGGKILVPPQTVAGWGVFSIFEAPGGAVQAIWEELPETGR